MTVETTKRLPCPTCGTSAADLNRRVEVEDRLIRASKGKLPPPTTEECLQLALKLGIPDDFPREPVAASRIEAISEAEPVAFIVYAKDSDNVVLWSQRPAIAEQALAKHPGSRLVPLFAHTPPAGHVVVPLEVMQARLDTLDACLETFWCITKDGSDNRLIAEGAQHEAASLRALLPHNQGGAK